MAALANQRQLARFENEVRASGELHHPNIVPVYSVGVERGIHFYAMQYVDGPTLAQVLQQLQSGGKPLSSLVTTVDGPGRVVGKRSDGDPGLQAEATTPRIRELQASITTLGHSSWADYCRTVADWGVQAAEALAYAHELGVVHRDIKPANLLVEDGKTIWITDFGLARLGAGNTMSIVASLAAVLIWLANTKTTRALADQETALTQSKKMADLARTAVDKMYVGIADRWMADQREQQR